MTPTVDAHPYAWPYDGTLDIRYWGTCGEDANDVKPQTPLLSTADFLTGATYLVTPTFGGVRQMNSSDKILMYRNAMLTRGRVTDLATRSVIGMTSNSGRSASSARTARRTVAASAPGSPAVRTASIIERCGTCAKAR